MTRHPVAVMPDFLPQTRAYVIPDPLLSPDHELIDKFGIENWGEWLSEGINDDIIMSIRKNTNTGWPTGSEEFVKGLEVLTGRRLLRQPSGRKHKGASGE